MLSLKKLQELDPEIDFLMGSPFTGRSEPTQLSLRSIQRLLDPQGAVPYQLGLLYDVHPRILPAGYRDVFEPMREAMAQKRKRAERLIYDELMPCLNAELSAAAVALAMSGHARLGEASPLSVLDSDLVGTIARAAGLLVPVDADVCG